MALGWMRRHKNWLKYFFWAVIAAFIILYIPAFQQGGGGPSGEAVGHVGGLTITAGEFRRAYLEQRQFYDRLYRGRMDEATLRSLRLGEQVFDGLVAARLMQLEADRLGIVVTDDEVRTRLTESPQFQRDGQFVGAAEIRRLLEQQGLSVDDFQRQLRDQIRQEKLQALITDPVLVAPDEVEREFRRRNEKVKLGYVIVDAAAFADSVEASDEEVRAHFDAAPESWRIPERRVLHYVLIDQQALEAQVTVTDIQVRNWYADNPDQFYVDEQTCASHVLIKVARDGGEGHPEEEARRLAEKALERIRAGEDFAAVAEDMSEDLGSRQNGGDLGCFTRGRMVKAFDQVAFELGEGEVSDLVRTDFGFHVIRVNARRPGGTRPFEEVQEGIRQRLVTEGAADLAEAHMTAISGALRDGATLEEAAGPRGFEVQTSEPIAPGETADPLASPLIASRAFEMKVGDTDPDPFAVPRGVAFISLAEVQEPRVPAFDEVEAEVRVDLLEERRRQRARERAEELSERAGRQGLERAASAQGLVRKELPSPVGRGEPLGELGSGAALEKVAYSLEPGAISEPVQVESGWAVLEVLEREPFDPVAFAGERTQLASSLRQQKRNRFFEAYMNEVRDRFRVERVPDVYRQIVG